MLEHYILVGREVMQVPMEEWSLFLADGHRIIAKDYIGDVEVSTVFIGINMNYFGLGPPLLFETMVFPDCDTIGRWSTLDEAEAEHAKVVAVYLAMAEAVSDEG